ncbi:MAG: hypothetical protein ACP5EQ_01285 [Candidatus Cloacimonadia bacterium]
MGQETGNRKQETGGRRQDETGRMGDGEKRRKGEKEIGNRMRQGER